MLPNGEIIVGHGDADEETQLLSFQDGVGKVLLDVPKLQDVRCSPNGVIYVLDLDDGGTRVQKVEGFTADTRCGQQRTSGRACV